MAEVAQLQVYVASASGVGYVQARFLYCVAHRSIFSLALQGNIIKKCTGTGPATNADCIPPLHVLAAVLS